MRFQDFLLPAFLGLVPFTCTSALQYEALDERAVTPVCGVAGLKIKIPFAVSLAKADTTPLG